MKLKFVYGDKSNPVASLARMLRSFLLYVKCFPDAKERETQQKLHLLFLRVPGWNFVQVFDEVTDALVAVCQFCVINEDSAVLEHLYVEPDRRREGIGTLVIEELERYLDRNIYAEMNDQHVMTRAQLEADDPPPEERNPFWDGLGFKMVNAGYRQPALEDWVPTQAELDLGVDPGEEASLEEGQDEEEGSVNYLCILVKTRKVAKTLPTRVYLKLVSGFFRTFLPADQEATQHPCYLETAEQLDGVEELELLKIGSKRTISQTGDPEEDE